MADKPIRKARVIDINAVLQQTGPPPLKSEDGSPASAVPAPASLAGVAVTSEDFKPYQYSGTERNVPAPLSEGPKEKDRLARRRAEIAEEQRQNELAAAAEALQQRAHAMVEACAPNDDEDEEEVLRKLAALENKLEAVGDVFAKRGEGQEESYQTWLAAERYRKEEAQRVIDIQIRKEAAIAATIEEERRFRDSLRRLIEGLVDSIDVLYEAELVRREAQRIADLDKALQDEANARIKDREQREAARAAEHSAYEAHYLYGSADPMIEEIRKASHERLQAYLKREAEDEAAEEAALEAKLQRLTSLRRR